MMVAMTAMAAMVATEHLQTLLSSQTMFVENITGQGEKVEVLKGRTHANPVSHLVSFSCS